MLLPGLIKGVVMVGDLHPVMMVNRNFRDAVVARIPTGGFYVYNGIHALGQN